MIRRKPAPHLMRGGEPIRTTRASPPDQAEEHAEAARDFIMVELVTKTDLNEALERWSLKLSVRLGFMLAAGIAALGVMVKLS